MSYLFLQIEIIVEIAKKKDFSISEIYNHHPNLLINNIFLCNVHFLLGSFSFVIKKNSEKAHFPRITYQTIPTNFFAYYLTYFSIENRILKINNDVTNTNLFIDLTHRKKRESHNRIDKSAPRFQSTIEYHFVLFEKIN